MLKVLDGSRTCYISPNQLEENPRALDCSTSAAVNSGIHQWHNGWQRTASWPRTVVATLKHAPVSHGCRCGGRRGGGGGGGGGAQGEEGGGCTGCGATNRCVLYLIGCCKAAVSPSGLLMSLFRAPAEIGCIFGLATRRWPIQHPDQRPLRPSTSGALSFSCTVYRPARSLFGYY